MSVAPHAGIIDFGTFTPPTGSIDGIQGEVPAPLVAEAGYVLSTNGWVPGGGGGGGGTVTSVAMTVPTGLSISGSPITLAGTLALTYTSGYSIPTTSSQTNWDAAYTQRLQWDGSSVNLVAATGRTSLGATTLGSNLFTITNPSAVTFPRFNADNTVSALDAATFRSAIGAGTSSTTGTVTSVAATAGTGISITGSPITTSGTLNITNTAPDQTVVLNNGTGISVTGTYPNFTITNSLPSSGGTVTSVAALTLGTTGTDLSSTVANGTTTPVITLNVPTASSTNRGALSSTDWSTFNGKQAALVSGTNIKTVGGTSLLGSGDVSVVTQIIAGTNVTISPVGGTGAVTINASGGGGGGSPGGANTNVQFNNSGSFGGSASLTWDGTTLKTINLEATAGILADASFSGTYVDGIVMDYTSGAGRISVGGSDDLRFYNGGIAGSELGHASSNGDWKFNGNITIGTGTPLAGAVNPLSAIASAAAGYIQSYIFNATNGVSSSADFTAYPNNGTDASGWVDMGITSASYADATYTCTGQNEGYVFMSAPSGAGKTGNLVYATDSTGSSNAHQWYVGGFTQAKGNYKMQLNASSLTVALPLNSTVATGTAPFTVASTTQVANLNAATAGTATTATTATTVSNTGAVSTNASFYPTFVAANTTSSQGVNTTGSFSINPSTNLVTAQALTLTGGSTTQPPLDFGTGTLMTTAQAGAMEFDGTAPYFDVATSTRGVLPAEQWTVLNATYTLTSQTAVQKIFNTSTNGQVTLPVGTYQFECVFALTGMSATSGSFGFALGGAATKTYAYYALASKGTSTSLTTATATTATFNTGAQTTLNTAGTGTAGTAMIKGIIRVTVAGTVIPQVSLTVASAAIIQAGSYFRVSPLGSATVTTVGNWT